MSQNVTKKLKIADIKAQDIYKLIKATKTPLTMEELRDMLNISNYTCRAAIKILVDSNLVEQIGGGRRAGPLTYSIKTQAGGEEVANHA